MDNSDPIRVLHIASGDLWAGAEVQLFTLANALNNQQNTTVEVVLLNHGTLEHKLVNIGINVVVLDETKLSGFQILQHLIKLIQKLRPDVIHTHRQKENTLGSIAALLSGRIPTLRTVHGAPEHIPAWYHIPKRIIIFLDWLCGRFLQHKIVAVSQDLSTILGKTFPAEKIICIDNGIDTSALIQTIKSPKTNGQTPIKVGIAGRLTSVKRVDLFIEVAQYLRKTHPQLDISFHIYGDGPLHGELQQLNLQLKTADIVHFEGYCENIYEELQTLNIILMTSDHEGLPMILLEAMALHVPIIAHAVGGIPNLLNHGECGILVEAHTVQAYAEAIYQLINNKESKAKLIQCADERVRKHFSAEGNANKYYQEYIQL